MLIPSATAQERQPDELFPPVEPFQTGYLRVSDVHEVYYELCGNPRGKPVFVLHGGPGGGCHPNMRRLYDPQRFLIVLHDQRGAGRSRPFAELRENNTQNLVSDIERLRRHLKLDRIRILGGSWGSTLALAYAEKHPEHVAGMVLRGVFTATDAEIEHFYGGGVRKLFPDTVATFEAALASAGKKLEPKQILALLQSDDPAVRRRFAVAWTRYELKMSRLHWPDKQLLGVDDDWNPYAFALLENHYMANRCFLQEDQLCHDAARLKDIPITMVNGRYDVLCPPATAYRLHRLLPKSKLVIVEEAGHSQSEPGITKALLRAIADFE